ncbi:hypothetical protein [Mesoflavibacter sp. CH_XMU1404-2]|uniref:hypothetical protein n=2 Tax=Flavobacteriaceae TaxID=49546 RepID=UPI0024393C00|tara:strand:- start:1897 stop:2253 length:357 start_codon:yes stop_codon:yes gene_type:complete
MKSILSSISAVFVALVACTCCVGPLMAFAGMLGAIVSQLVWLATIKPYLIAFSLIAVSYNLYRAYFPKKEQACCTIESQETISKLDTKQKKSLSFLQSKTFLWCVAIITLIILILPYI